MLLLIDNYDSFTYNLVHYLGELGAEVAVHRNDALNVQEAMALKPEGILLSPGPCDPDQAGICLALVEAAAETKTPLMGVCLGHQSLVQHFGGNIIREQRLPPELKVYMPRSQTRPDFDSYHDPHDDTPVLVSAFPHAIPNTVTITQEQ